MKLHLLLQSILRKRTPILFSDDTRVQPISRVFGLDRGIPIDRYYIEKFFQEKSYLIHGEVLEIADDVYCKKFGGDQVRQCHVMHPDKTFSNATVVGDLTDISSLPAGQMDCFVCTQTLNFIYDINAAIQGAHYLLKPGGVMLATVAGICQISRYDMDRWGDFWRFTTASLHNLFSPVFTGGIEIKSYGNVLAATSLLQGVALEDLPNMDLLDFNDPDYQVLLTIVARKAG